ncbi:MAG TPA: hypothetical protein VKU90_14145 [Caulobacteraceae bacterium]|nr:hypothetical protein [Caulobacteraceae bacterium]
MGRVSVGDAINEGFRLIGRAPVPVLLWGFVQVAFAAAVFTILSPVYMAMFDAARSGAADPAAIQAFSGRAQSLQGFSLLIDALQVVLYSVVYCAVFRAVLHPEQSQFAYLRLGMAELFFGALFVGGYVVVASGAFAVVLVFAIVIGVLIAVHQVAAAIVIGVLAVIAMMVALFYLLLRFALIGPMIVEDGKFHLGDAWRLTRGHVLSLFLIGLVLALIALAAEIVIGLVLVAIGLGGLAALAGGFQNIAPFLQQPGALVRLAPLLVIFAIIWVPFIGCLSTLMSAPWARAYRDLKPPDVAATFV